MEDKRLNLYQKIAALADYISDQTWKKDGVNAAQKYKYISEAQYKQIHGDGVRKVGLIFKFTVLERTFTQNITQSMHLVSVKVQMEYIDPETGERETYISFGDGADSGDKGIYKAETGAYKYHISTNFHVAADSDPEKDLDPNPQGGKKSTFTTPEGQKKAKTDILAGDVASEEDVKKLTKVFAEYEKLFPDKAAAFRAANPDFKAIKAVAMKAILPNIVKVVNEAKAPKTEPQGEAK